MNCSQHLPHLLLYISSFFSLSLPELYIRLSPTAESNENFIKVEPKYIMDLETVTACRKKPNEIKK